MTIETQTIEVYIPENGKAFKLSHKGKLITYMLGNYYKLHHYEYDVEEVPIDEAIKWLDKANSFATKIFNRKSK